MTLPDRDGVVGGLAEMLTAFWHRRAARQAEGGELADRSCALLLIEVEGFERLNVTDPDGSERIDEEITRRLDRLVRSSDVLGRTAGDRYVLAADSVAPSAVGALIERLRSAFAMPIALGETFVSFPVEVAVALADPAQSTTDPSVHAATMMVRAEVELERHAR